MPGEGGVGGGSGGAASGVSCGPRHWLSGLFLFPSAAPTVWNPLPIPHSGFPEASLPVVAEAAEFPVLRDILENI